jgi:trehalose 6-phosphate synthase
VTGDEDGDPLTDDALGGEAFVVVANRLPVDEVTGQVGNGGANGTETVTSPDGRVWRRSPGGLVSALYPLLAKRSQATWVGWTGAPGPAPEPFELTGFAGDGESTGTRSGIRIHPVPLSEQEFDEYYEGYANATLWPLYHDAVQMPVHHREWAAANRTVNRRFAETVDRVSPRGATVWVHDYQLQLVPAMLRERRPDLRIGFFLHIPFPPVELFMQLPQRVEIMKGLLGADLVGFQTPRGAQNFLHLAQQLLGLRRRGQWVQVDDRWVRAEAFPISIDVEEMRRLVSQPSVRTRAAEIRDELGHPKVMILGVDRLDYTKGIGQRLRAYRELLTEGRVSTPDTVFVQVATPSRERVEHYAQLREDVEREVGHINGEFGRVGIPAVHYLRQSYSREELAALYLAADVMAVTPLRDGMNLVAKEYVAAREDLRGALVLSEFAGAARELKHAYMCNPHDIDSIKDALMRAVEDDPESISKRMTAMRRYLRRHDVRRWATDFITALRMTEAGPDGKAGADDPERQGAGAA